MRVIGGLLLERARRRGRRPQSSVRGRSAQARATRARTRTADLARLGELDVLRRYCSARSSSYISPSPEPSIASAERDPQLERVARARSSRLCWRSSTPRSMLAGHHERRPDHVQRRAQACRGRRALASATAFSPQATPSALSRLSMRSVGLDRVGGRELGARAAGSRGARSRRGSPPRPRRCGRARMYGVVRRAQVIALAQAVAERAVELDRLEPRGDRLLVAAARLCLERIAPTSSSARSAAQRPLACRSARAYWAAASRCAPASAARAPPPARARAPPRRRRPPRHDGRAASSPRAGRRPRARAGSRRAAPCRRSRRERALDSEPRELVAERDAVARVSSTPASRHSSSASSSAGATASSSHSSARAGTSATRPRAAAARGGETRGPRQHRVAHRRGQRFAARGEQLGDEERVPARERVDRLAVGAVRLGELAHRLERERGDRRRARPPATDASSPSRRRSG